MNAIAINRYHRINKFLGITVRKTITLGPRDIGIEVDTFLLKDETEQPIAVGMSISHFRRHISKLRHVRSNNADTLSEKRDILLGRAKNSHKETVVRVEVNDAIGLS
jgi:hypothetical protein